MTAVQHGNYFKLKSFLACLHPKVREKVDLEGPNTFEEALNLACQKSKKIKRKWEQGSMDLGGGLVEDWLCLITKKHEMKGMQGCQPLMIQTW